MKGSNLLQEQSHTKVCISNDLLKGPSIIENVANLMLFFTLGIIMKRLFNTKSLIILKRIESQVVMSGNHGGHKLGQPLANPMAPKHLIYSHVLGLFSKLGNEISSEALFCSYLLCRFCFQRIWANYNSGRYDTPKHTGIGALRPFVNHIGVFGFPYSTVLLVRTTGQ